MSRQFQRPVEYDPSLALSSSSSPPAKTKAERLVDEFGFEPDEDGDIDFGFSSDEGSEGDAGSGLDTPKGPQRGKNANGSFSLSSSSSPSASSSSRSAATKKELEEEIHLLIDQLRQSNDSRLKSEEKARVAEQRSEELQRLSSQAKQILVKQFNERMKALQETIEEQKQQIQEDEQCIIELKGKIASASPASHASTLSSISSTASTASSPSSSLSSNSSMNEATSPLSPDMAQEMQKFKESLLFYTHENTELKQKISQLNQAIKQQKEAAANTMQERDAARAKLEEANAAIAQLKAAPPSPSSIPPPPSIPVPLSNPEDKATIARMEAERDVFRDEIRKRMMERADIVGKINALVAGDKGIDALRMRTDEWTEYIKKKYEKVKIEEREKLVERVVEKIVEKPVIVEKQLPPEIKIVEKEVVVEKEKIVVNNDEIKRLQGEMEKRLKEREEEYRGLLDRYEGVVKKNEENIHKLTLEEKKYNELIAHHADEMKRKDAEHAHKVEAMESKYVSLQQQHGALLLHASSSDQHVKSLEEQLNQLKQSANQSQLETSKQLETIQKKLEEENQALNSQLINVTREKNAVSEEKERGKEEIERLQAEKVKLLDSTKNLTEELQRVLEERRALEAMREEGEKERVKLLHEINQLKETNSNVNKETETLSQEKESLSQEKAALVFQITALQRDVSSAQAEKGSLSQQILSLTDERSQLQALHSSLSSQMAALEEEKRSLLAAQQGAAEEKAQFERVVSDLNEALSKREAELEAVKDKAKDKLTLASDTIKKLKSEYSILKTEYQKIKAHNQLNKEHREKRKNVFNALASSNMTNRAVLHVIKQEISQLSAMFDGMQPILIREFNDLINRRQHLYNSLLLSYQKEVKQRKQLFNQLQELKGNIRCYVRIRPLSAREADSGDNCITITDEEHLTIENPEKKSVNEFAFERIFAPDSTQEQVFDEVNDLITSVMDGYNCCLFAYGQTGTGKTYTMEGPKENPGVNIRALRRLFAIQAERAAEMVYEIKLTLLEIYNEKIQDLLNPEGKKVLKAVNGQYGMEVPDLTYVPVQNSDEVLETLRLGQKNRKVTATAMNDASSRSHLILSVYVLGSNLLTKKTHMGKLHLIDLAGSERVSRSGVTGDAMKEAQAINSSLSALGNVISARGEKRAHVPYRDSQLTYLLQDSLEKNSKTLMFVQLSPNASDAGETLCSLRFAERVKKVELGKASVNEKKGAK